MAGLAEMGWMEWGSRFSADTMPEALTLPLQIHFYSNYYLAVEAGARLLKQSWTRNSPPEFRGSAQWGQLTRWSPMR